MRKLSGSIFWEVNWGRAFLSPGNERPEGLFQAPVSPSAEMCAERRQGSASEGRNILAPNFIPLVP